MIAVDGITSWTFEFTHTTEPHLRNAGENTKPSAGQLISLTAEGLDYRFLRRQPRVIGPGLLRRARPRRLSVPRELFNRREAIGR